ncbi:MAG TPA: cytochrome b [Methylophaga aminisulfidivorans]|uniref:Cytochrome b n=2 Tax=root TaxID=1 RepID=A0A7C1VQR3_9GAMM|nr:cytochrome b [Methylophaga aminisulfidivorans]
MNSPNTSIKSYNLVMKVIHWGMALLIFSLIFAGLSMIRSLEPWQPTLLSIHKNLGVIAFIAVLARLLVRLRTVSPSLDNELPSLQRFIAKLTHILMYMAMILMPVSGFLMQNFAGRPIYIFDTLMLPSITTIDLGLYGLFREIHGITAVILILLILMHISAALYHAMIRRDSIFDSMWF